MIGTDYTVTKASEFLPATRLFLKWHKHQWPTEWIDNLTNFLGSTTPLPARILDHTKEKSYFYYIFFKFYLKILLKTVGSDYLFFIFQVKIFLHSVVIYIYLSRTEQFFKRLFDNWMGNFTTIYICFRYYIIKIIILFYIINAHK